MSVTEITPYENNPRNNENAIEAVMESIRQCEYVAPIIVDENGVILAGHTRYEALKRLGQKEIEVMVATGLSDEQKRKYRLLDNKTNEFAEWDYDLLAEELDDLDFGEFDFGFALFEDEEEKPKKENPYTTKVNIPQYEITGAEPELNELYSTEKTNQLIDEIEKAEVPAEIKDFLRIAAYRHTVFNYRNIAEYYAHAEKTVQELMEQSALVIIDVDNAIANGYVKLTKKIEELMEDD